jgi:hypothetical protein
MDYVVILASKISIMLFFIFAFESKLLNWHLKMVLGYSSFLISCMLVFAFPFFGA